MRLLSELKASDSIPALLQGMTDPEIFDYALKDLAFALGSLGRPALDPILRAIEAPGLDEFQLITFKRVLRDIAIVDPEARDRVVSLLLSFAQNSERPPEVRAFCLRYLIELEATDTFDAVEALFEDALFTQGVAVSPVRLREQIRRIRAGSTELAQKRQWILSRFSSWYPADEGKSPIVP
jgi:hypothetical protein